MRNCFDRGISFIPIHTLLVRISIPGSKTLAFDKDEREFEFPLEYEVCFESKEEEIRYTRINWEDLQLFIVKYAFHQSPSNDPGQRS